MARMEPVYCGGSWKIGPYKLGKTIGTGRFSRVKVAKNTETGELVAVKIIRNDVLEQNPSLKTKMRREISILKVLSHPNLISLIDVYEIDTHLFLVMEYVRGVELYEYICEKRALPSAEALLFFQQIITGIEYCHQRLICHRDMKPENFLLDNHLNLKIADFGMTSLARPGSLLETACGSPHYCDPMVISGKKYDGRQADLWSCGVILFVMVTGKLPFNDDNMQNLLRKVQLGRFDIPQNIPFVIRDLISGMLTVDPEYRLTLEQIKLHPWYSTSPPRLINNQFTFPTDIISTPNALVLKSLVGLGWGNEEQVGRELSSESGNVLKVLYTALLAHPITQRHLVEPVQVDFSATNKTSAVVLAQPIPTNGLKDLPQQTSNEIEIILNAKDSSNMHKSFSAPAQMSDTLVRQSSFARLGITKDEEIQEIRDPEEGLENRENEVHEAVSWFEAIRRSFRRIRSNDDEPAQMHAEPNSDSGTKESDA